MNDPNLKEALCRAFCDDIAIREVEAGLVISARYSDEIGDPIECFVEQSSAGQWIMSDDGQFIPDLIGKGIDVTTKSRSEFLQRAMKVSGAYYDPDDYTIRIEAQDQFPPPSQIIDFLTTLLRARDISFWNKERIRSTFKEDAFAAIASRLTSYRVTQNSFIPGIEALQDFPADIVVTDNVPRVGKAVAIFLVQDVAAMNEALTLWFAASAEEHEVPVLALVEDAHKLNMNGPKVQRALNRIDAVAIWDENHDAAAAKIAKTTIRELALD